MASVRLLTNPAFFGVWGFVFGASSRSARPGRNRPATPNDPESAAEHALVRGLLSDQPAKAYKRARQHQRDLLDVPRGSGQQALLGHLAQAAHARVAMPVQLLGVGEAAFDRFLEPGIASTSVGRRASFEQAMIRVPASHCN